MKNFAHALFLALAIGFLSIEALAQQSASPGPAPRGYVLEVTYFKGRILAYQRIGEWTWYGFFQRAANWKSSQNEVPIEAVKISTRTEDSVIKARVTVLRGKNLETEDFVADHAVLPDKKTIVRELATLGIEPFELELVRAPSTVAEPPSIVNNTKSLQVSVEAKQSTLPTFLARVLNNSPKPVASFSYFTSIDGVRKLSGAPRNETGAVLIKPGDTFERAFRHPMKVSPISTGEVPPVVPNLVFNVTSVVFTDGTYEGDAFAAATYLAIKLGEKAQVQSFLDRVRSKGFTNSAEEVEAAMSMVDLDSLAAETAQKVPTLTAQEKAQLSELVGLGKSFGVKFIRSLSGQSTPGLVERLQRRIDELP